MRHIAIIGSGPAGYYTAEAAQKLWGDEVRVDIFDRLPVPYGLIRSGVAPDHQSIKAVARRYEAVSLADNARFLGNVTIGEDVSIAELMDLYDAVILATGAPHDKMPGLPGETLGNVFGSAAFVGWYNGHPQFAALDPDLSGTTAVIIGNGNVALDVARILAKTRDEFHGSDIVGHAIDRLDSSRIERIVILGRRGPHQIAMTPKELGELGHLARAAPRVAPTTCPTWAKMRSSSPASANPSPICAISPRFAMRSALPRLSISNSISSLRPGQSLVKLASRALKSNAPGWTAAARSVPARPIRSPLGWLSPVSATRPRPFPACPSRKTRGASPTTRVASCPGCIASAGPGADLRAPSAPTARTASR